MRQTIGEHGAPRGDMIGDQSTPYILSGEMGDAAVADVAHLLSKQLLPLVGDKTLLQQAALRVAGDAGFCGAARHRE